MTINKDPRVPIPVRGRKERRVPIPEAQGLKVLPQVTPGLQVLKVHLLPILEIQVLKGHP